MSVVAGGAKPAHRLSMLIARKYGRAIFSSAAGTGHGRSRCPGRPPLTTGTAAKAHFDEIDTQSCHKRGGLPLPIWEAGGGEGVTDCRFVIERPKPLTPPLSLWERELAACGGCPAQGHGCPVQVQEAKMRIKRITWLMPGVASKTCEYFRGRSKEASRGRLLTVGHTASRDGCSEIMSQSKASLHPSRVCAVDCNHFARTGQPWHKAGHDGGETGAMRKNQGLP